MSEVVGLVIKTDDYEFEISKCEQGTFQISADPIHIWFPAELVELHLCSGLDFMNENFEAQIRVRSMRGSRVQFRAFMTVELAKKINKYFPEIGLVAS